MAGSFLELWGADPSEWPALSGEPLVDAAEAPKPESLAESEPAPPVEAVFGGWRRILPHQLARKPDGVRSARHESAAEEMTGDVREDPIEYGTWWHETVEFLPWGGPESDRSRHLASALETARRRGFEVRAGRELGLLRASNLWRQLTSGDWQIFAELGVVAPLGGSEWVDGVIDLVAQKADTGELLVVDWKTNRRRAGETEKELLERLASEYRPQLQAYAQCLDRFFPGRSLTWGIYATEVGGLILG